MHSIQILRFTNPITHAELRYQARAVVRPHRWIRRFVRAVILCAYLLGSILFGSQVALTILIDSDRTAAIGLYLLLDMLGTLPLIPLIIVLAMHFSLMLRTLILSANSIARESQSSKWDMLILTGIDAGIIVRGKWWATIQSMWRYYVRLALLRALVIGWFGAIYNQGYVISSAYYLYGGSRADMVVPTIQHFLLAMISVFALTMANLPFTAACGVSAFNKRSGIAVVRGAVTRLLIIVVAVIVITVLNGFALFRGTDHNFLQHIGSRVLVTLVDNGITSASEIVSYHFDNSYYTDTSIFWLISLFVSLGCYALLTFLLLRFAQWQAIRQNASPPVPSKVSSSA